MSVNGAVTHLTTASPSPQHVDTPSVAAGASYAAFISYSHADSKAAVWLHRALERYRVPKRLVGGQTPMGIIPRALGRCFRDRDELAAAADLTDEIVRALDSSGSLIVICSPAAAASPWVNQEIITFKRRRGAHRVFAVILAGEPYADDPAQECFPPALRFQVDDSGSLSTRRAEPIGADLRTSKDGRRLALTKIVAAILGVGLDELIRREAQRRQRQLAVITAATAALAVLFAALALVAVKERSDAERRRSQAEGLVEFMITDLRHKLQPIGKLELLESVGERALAYFADQSDSDRNSDMRGRQARALQLMGEIAENRAQDDVAARRFTDAYALSEAGLLRDPDNPTRLYEHGQSAYWLGSLAWSARDYERAVRYFAEYRDLMAHALALKPGDSRFLAEHGAALTDLGLVHLRQQNTDASMHELDQAVVSFNDALQGSDDPTSVRHDLATTYGWTADLHRTLGDLATARELRQRQLSAYDALLAEHDDKGLAYSRVGALRALAALSLDLGQLQEAAGWYGQALPAAAALVRQDGDNSRWLVIKIETELDLAGLDIAAGRTAQGLARIDDQLTTLASKARGLGGLANPLADMTLRATTLRAEAAWQSLGAAAALEQVDTFQKAETSLLESAARRPSSEILVAEFSSIRARLLGALGQTAAARTQYRDILDRFGKSGTGAGIVWDSLLAAALEATGQEAEAQRLMARHCAGGFGNTEFGFHCVKPE